MKTLNKTIPDDVRDDLLGRDGVRAVGLGVKRVNGRPTDEEAVVVFVERKLPESQLASEDIVPETVPIEGQDVETDVLDAGGEFWAQQEGNQFSPPPGEDSPRPQQATAVRGQSQQQSATTLEQEPENGEPASETEPSQIPVGPGMTRRDRWRPVAPAGVSVGHESITAGTLGTPPLVTQDHQKVFLTNAHVAAPHGNANVGDLIIQPGTYDGGRAPDDRIGELLEWSELSTEEANTTDSALVLIDDDSVDADVLGLSDLRGWDTASYDETVYKSGRTTGTTSSSLVARDVDIQVNYHGLEEPVRFTGVDVFDAFSAGGDSGGLIGVLRSDGFYGTDLLFAGSSQYTIGIPMEAVQETHGQLVPLDTPSRRRSRPSQGVPSQPPGTDRPSPSDTQETTTEERSTAQATYTALTGSVGGSETITRWHGPWDPGYTVQFSTRPTTAGGYVRSTVDGVFRSSNGYNYYLIEIQNRKHTSTDYEVKATYEYTSN